MESKVKNYVDYDIACSTFDYGRCATGINEMVGMIYGMLGKPLDQVRLLDAGAGTGNYSKAFLDKGIGHVIPLDESAGMLKVAEEKLSTEISQGRVPELKHHSLPSIPYPDKSFDVVTFIHVVHQLDTQNEGQEKVFTNLNKVMEEAYRVLDSNGVVMVKKATQEQILKGAWFRPLIPKAAKKFQRKYMPIPDFIELLKRIGFKEIALVYCPGMLSNMVDEVYHDEEGPLKPEWRGTNSMWNTVDDDELDAAIHKMKEMKKKGTLHNFFEENDKYRKINGQSILVVAKK